MKQNADGLSCYPVRVFQILWILVSCFRQEMALWGKPTTMTEPPWCNAHFSSRFRADSCSCAGPFKVRLLFYVLVDYCIKFMLDDIARSRECFFLCKLGLKNLQGCSCAFWLDNIELSSLQGFIFPSFLSNVITIHEWLPHALCARLFKFCVFSFYVKELETWKASVSNLHETVVQRFFFSIL